MQLEKKILVSNLNTFLKSSFLFEEPLTYINSEIQVESICETFELYLKKYMEQENKKISKETNLKEEDLFEIEDVLEKFKDYVNKTPKEKYAPISKSIKDTLRVIKRYFSENCLSSSGNKDDTEIQVEVEPMKTDLEAKLKQKTEILYNIVNKAFDSESELVVLFDQLITQYCDQRQILLTSSDTRQNKNINKELIINIKSNDGVGASSKKTQNQVEISQNYLASDVIDMYITRDLKKIDESLEDQSKINYLIKEQNQELNNRTNVFKSEIDQLENDYEIIKAYLKKPYSQSNYILGSFGIL